MDNNRDFAMSTPYGDDLSAPQQQYSNGTPNRTEYLSVNNQNNVQFYSNAPAGSRHASRIANLCATVQSDILPKQPPRTSKALFYRPAQQALPPVSPLVPVAQPLPTQSPARQPSSRVAQNPPPRAAPTVTRYEDGQRVTYRRQSDNGVLLVSAPPRSVEAQAFEAIARELTVPNVCSVPLPRTVSDSANGVIGGKSRVEQAPPKQKKVVRRRQLGWIW